MKGVILAPCLKTIDTAGIAQLFFHFVFKHFGLHDTLILDRGPQFASSFAKELACLLKYNELETYLHIFCTNNPTKWVLFLPSAEFHHNSTPHTPPRHLRFPSSMAINHAPIPPWERPSSLHWRNICLDLTKPEKRLWLPMTPLGNSWHPEPHNISFLGKLVIRSGSRPCI